MHNHHHNWYHGCWSGHSHSNWYAPLAWGAVGWGLGSLTSSWGYPYSYSYVNPYYAPSAVATPVQYDYAQPIVINDYYDASGSNQSVTTQAVPPTEGALPAEEMPPPPPVEDSPQVQQGYKLLDEARTSFLAQNYTAASAQVQQAIAKVPGDPILHEFSALCMFTMKDYQTAAAVLNNLMSVAPGMDWTTLSSLYTDTSVYEQQLGSLQDFCNSHPNDAAAHFVLAYHRLICGDAEAATEALQVVVQQQPKDEVARRMLQAINPPDPSETESSTPLTPAPGTEAVASDTPQPTTDLIGPWQAERDQATFDLQLDEEGGFAWKSSMQGQDPVELSGDLHTDR